MNILLLCFALGQTSSELNYLQGTCPNGQCRPIYSSPQLEDYIKINCANGQCVQIQCCSPQRYNVTIQKQKSIEKPQYRVWQSSDKKYKTTARLLTEKEGNTFEQGIIKLRKDNGDIIDVDIVKLSLSDVIYLQKAIKKQPPLNDIKSAILTGDELKKKRPLPGYVIASISPL